MKAKTFTIITIVMVFTLALSGAVVAKEPQLPALPAQVENDVGLPSFAAPMSALQQMASPQVRNVALIGQIGGSARAIAIQGDLAYVGIGSRLAILDVSDPAQPLLIGQTAFLPVNVKDVAVAGNYAYVVGIINTSGSVYLSIIDMSVPSSPHEVGHYNTGQRGAENVTIEVAGTYAFVADISVGLCIIDVSLPRKPSKIGSYKPPDWLITDVAVVGDYAYVTNFVDYATGMKIIDVSHPASPIQVGYYPGYAKSVVVSGDYAYLIGDGLHIIDISTPSAPTEVGSYRTPHGGFDVAVAGSYAYVADGYYGLRILDVSNPGAPVEVGYYDPQSWIYDVVVAGNYAYVADDYSGVHIIDVSTPSTPVEALFYNPAGGPAVDVAVVGNYAYVANGASGFHIIDISVPNAPVVVGYHPGYAERVVVSEDYAYVIGNGLRIIDVSIPSSPVEVGYYITGGTAYSLAVAGSYAYVVDLYSTIWDSYSSLYVIDVSKPRAPVAVGRWLYNYPGGVETNGVVVSGHYAYITDRDNLRIIDINVPSNPTQVGSYVAQGWVEGVAIAGNYVYISVAYDNGGNWVSDLVVIDVNLPSAPRFVSSYSPGNGWPGGVYLQGDYAYIACNGLRIIDVSTPSTPVEIGYYRIGGSVIVSGNYIYLAAGGDGLLILADIPPLLIHLPLVYRNH